MRNGTPNTNNIERSPANGTAIENAEEKNMMMRYIPKNNPSSAPLLYTDFCSVAIY